jgi:hypothetical protein
MVFALSKMVDRCNSLIAAYNIRLIARTKEHNFIWLIAVMQRQNNKYRCCINPLTVSGNFGKRPDN